MTNEQIKLNIVRTVNYENDVNWNFPINRHPYNTLYLVVGGDGYVRIDNVVTPLRTGKAYLIPPNTLFSCWCDHTIHKLYIDVYAEIVPGYDIFSHKNAIQEIEYPLSQTLALIEQTQKKTLKANLFVNGEIEKILSNFMDEDFELSNPDILRFKPMLKDIEEHLSAQIKVNDIANKYNFNPSVLSRSFKKAFHCSLKHQIEMLLLNKIKQELILTNKTIKEISLQYDFCDQYYMSGFFKKYEHCSPTQYRQNNGMK